VDATGFVDDGPVRTSQNGFKRLRWGCLDTHEFAL
jgi:hypothetical protein